MKIHEYQAKELFSKRDIAVPKGLVVTDEQQLDGVLEQLGLPVVVKAQVRAGGRGKGGGVRLASTGEDARIALSQILGMTLVTRQTGSKGERVDRVLVEEGVAIAQELYLALLVDRDSGEIMIMLSLDGGMDIEEVAAKSPERIVRIGVDPLAGLQGFHLRRAGFGLGLAPAQHKELAALLKKLYSFFVDHDLLLLEVNPLVLTEDGSFVVLDAKVEIDSNALFRHPRLQELADDSGTDSLEQEAAAAGLNYIRLEGNVGNMVNGAGLAMATMDLIKQAGAEPANFLDVGGGASAEMVEKGFRIILADPNVKAIFINIFGGILRCDILARGVVEAARNVGLPIPVLVRMEGTNVDEGRRILADSGLDLSTADNLASAAKSLAAMVK
ncbi:MAG: ADP-forming succinate--CoA ligase subunit beta [Thermodesulfobacteriota bacterium]